jgi:hypothetical protein
MLTYYTLKKLREEREKNGMQMETTEQEIQINQDVEFAQEVSPMDEVAEMVNESQEITNEQLDEKPKKK